MSIHWKLCYVIYKLYTEIDMTYVRRHCDTECCCMWPADITVEYCRGSDM